MSFVEKVRDRLDLIENENPSINALLFVCDRDEMLEAARDIEERIDAGRAGRLAGRTVAVKANINVLGLPISCASKALESYVGTYDADVIERIREEDGLIIGIANCDEFASGSSGTHSAFGPTRNPADTDRITGGSSSGSAAAVAAGFCDIALGTDTGGSVRNPASHCGVVAIKPSYGRVSRHGVIDLSMSLDQVGPIARDVEDALLTLEVIGGPSQRDATTRSAPMPVLSSPSDGSALRLATLDLAGLRVDPDVLAVFERSVELLEKRFGSIPRVSVPQVPLCVATYYPIVYTEFFSSTRRFDGRRYGLRIDDHAGVEVRRRIRAGARIARAEDEHRFYRKALSVRASITASFERAFEDYDVILSPVVPRIARPIDEQVKPEDEYAEDALTIPANLAGLCAASVPAGEARGMPVGIQLVARSLGEDQLARGMRVVADVLNR